MNTIYNLQDLKENLKIEETNENGVFELKSPIEHLKIFEKEGKKILQRNYDETNISDKYFPVPDSYILKGLVNQNYWNDMIDGVESLELKDKGGFAINFRQSFKDIGEVLDVIKVDRSYQAYYFHSINDVAITKSPYGDYKKRLQIVNSFDKSKRFSIVLGLLRMICTNGAYALKESDNNFVSGRILHLDCNKEEITSGITTMLEKIPFLMKEADLLGEMKSQTLSSNVKDLYLKDVTEYINKRETSEIEKKKEQYTYSYLNSMKQMIEETLEQSNNVLDFVNVLSYFQVRNRFASVVIGLAKILNNKMKKIYSENN